MAVGGAAVGWVIATFVTRGFSADWVGATGTWFGSIATVLTLLWAVNVFLGDAAQRQRAEKREQDRQVAAAARVSAEIHAGGGHIGQAPGTQIMQNVQLKLINLTSDMVSIEKAELPARFVITDTPIAPRFPLSIPAGESVTLTSTVQDVEVKDGLLGGKLMTDLATIEYTTAHGRWRRIGKEAPTRL